MLAYGLPAFSKGDPNSFLAGMARVSGLIKKVCLGDIIQAYILIAVTCSMVP